MKYILILTMLNSVSSGMHGAGNGGLATAVFEDKAACESAAQQWKSQFYVLKPGSSQKAFDMAVARSDKSRNFITAMCVPQSSAKQD